jgi:hypothetical protein
MDYALALIAWKRKEEIYELPLYVPVIFHEYGLTSLSSLLKNACCINKWP